MEVVVSEIFISSKNIRRLLKTLVSEFSAPEILNDIANSLNINQMKNKEWLIDHVISYIDSIPKHPNIAIIAGWYGLAGGMLAKQVPCDITVIDKNPSCAIIGKKLFPNLKHVTSDINDTSLKNYDIIICTACEHISDEEINDVIRKKDKSTIVFLQSNNYNEIEDHTNCKNSVDDFANSLKLNVYKKYTLSLDKYERFMVIGK